MKVDDYRARQLVGQILGITIEHVRQHGPVTTYAAVAAVELAVKEALNDFVPEGERGEAIQHAQAWAQRAHDLYSPDRKG